MGTVGTLLGEAGINIQAAQISQTKTGNDAFMLLRADRQVDASVLDSIGLSIAARNVRAVTFDA
jgi:D-3-phosphoglycerate dehydrogenase